MQLALGVDTSNYATSLAVVDADAREVVYTEKRMLPVRAGETGLRQSEAVFHHTVALPQMFAELRAQLPNGALRQVTAVGVSTRPRPVEGSYMPCFLAGESAAAAFAAAQGLPVVCTSHQQGHLAAALLGAKEEALYTGNVLFLHLSGGTTDLLLTNGYTVLDKIGGSADLYAGQAVDRLGVKLGFGFPAGPALSALALQCTVVIHPKVSCKGLACHFSGLQNQCERLLADGHAPAYVAKYCLLAVADTLTALLREALRQYPGCPVLCAGGVMSSEVIRPRLKDALHKVYFAPPSLSGDNAVGVAMVAAHANNNSGEALLYG